MTLTSKQIAAIEKGEPVSVVIEQTECVVIRKDIYQQTRDLLPEETYPAVLEAWDAMGSPDDGELYK